MFASPINKRSEIQGVVVGVVTNNSDPVGLGRVKVKYPWLGDQVESAWCRVAAPMAGGERGFYFIPEINDEVLIAFEHGDPSAPIFVGALWSVADKPYASLALVIGGQRHVLALDATGGRWRIGAEAWRGLPAGGEFEVSLSDGVESVMLVVPRR